MLEITLLGIGILLSMLLIRIARYVEQVDYEKRRFYAMVEQELTRLDNMAKQENEIKHNKALNRSIWESNQWDMRN